MGKTQVFSNRIFWGSSWPLIVFYFVFDSVTIVKTKIGQDLLINNLLFHSDTRDTVLNLVCMFIRILHCKYTKFSTVCVHTEVTMYCKM
jgi:hypothetical protein